MSSFMDVSYLSIKTDRPSMKGKNLQEKSSEELLKQAKTIKLVTGILAGMLLTLFVMAVYLSAKQGFNVLLTVPLALLPIVLLNVGSLKEIQKELNARGEH